MSTRAPAQRGDLAWRVVALVEAVAILGFGFALLNGGAEPAPPTPFRATSTHPVVTGDAGARAQGGASGLGANPALHHDERAQPSSPPERAVTPGSSNDGSGRAATSAAEDVAEGARLVGRFLSEDGKPLKTARGWISRESDPKRLATLEPQGDAHFAAAGLPEGRLRVRARAEGFVELDEIIEVPPGVREIAHDLVLVRTWTLGVKIATPDGIPLQRELARIRPERRSLTSHRVMAVATPWAPEGDFPATRDREVEFGVPRWRSPEDGSSNPPRIRGDQAGLFDFSVRRKLWISAVLRHHVLATEVVEPGQAEVTLVVPLERVLSSFCIVRLRAVHAGTGAPLVEAKVGLARDRSGLQPRAVDAHGRIELRDVEPGAYALSIQDPSCTFTGMELNLQPGQEIDLGDLLLIPARRIEVRCEGITGEAGRLRITALSLEAPAHSALRPIARQAAREEGRFHLEVPEGRYLLRASGAGSSSLEVDTRDFVDRPIVMQLGAEAPLRIQAPSDGELYHVAVYDERDREVWGEWLKSRPVSVSLALGDYRVVTIVRGARTERQISIGPGGADLRVPD